VLSVPRALAPARRARRSSLRLPGRVTSSGIAPYGARRAPRASKDVEKVSTFSGGIDVLSRLMLDGVNFRMPLTPPMAVGGTHPERTW
jgi:hypothetical protein